MQSGKLNEFKFDALKGKKKVSKTLDWENEQIPFNTSFT